MAEIDAKVNMSLGKWPEYRNNLNSTDTRYIKNLKIRERTAASLQQLTIDKKNPP